MIIKTAFTEITIHKTHLSNLRTDYTNPCLYFQKFPIEEGRPDYEIVEITPNELEAIVNIKNPAVDHLMYPAEYFEVLEGNK